ncbi:MAG: tRNA 2-thiocytidine biosynthesis protein TtcA [Clostridiales bacterium]|nr:tRNA 2-thiocytidine biosynthesis protein TtcA [Clostridiales bacterium]
MEGFTGLVRRCVEDYNMIDEGDNIAVGLSGGKDSLALLCALSHLRAYYPKHFTLSAVTVDMGFDGMDFTPVKELCRRLVVPYRMIKTNIRHIVFENRSEKNPCSLCARMRRGKLNETIIKAGMNKLALGHHRDDAAHTFLLSLFYEGRIHCFQPVTWLDRSGVTQIRPLLYAGEKDILSMITRYKLPVVESTCPMNNISKRQEVKALSALLNDRYPDLTAKIFGAMQRYPLKGFAPARRLKQKYK